MNGLKAHMIYTDPPYNINYAEFNKNRGNGKDWTDEYCSEWEDSMSDDDYNKFIKDFLQNAKNNMIPEAHYYIWHATTYFIEFIQALRSLEIPYDKVPIQWVKQSAPLSWVHYKRKSEPCIFAGVKASTGNGRWFGPNNETNIWEINRDRTNDYVHPTQKPVELAARAINNSSQVNEIVLDLFLGSGTSLIASDKLSRLCFGMEYEPKFVDVIVKRYFMYCDSNNIECNVKLNGNPITLDYFGDNNE